MATATSRRYHDKPGIEGVYTSRDATITASTEYAFGGRRVVLTTQENGQELISQIRLSKREAIVLRNVLDAAIERASENVGHADETIGRASCRVVPGA